MMALARDIANSFIVTRGYAEYICTDAGTDDHCHFFSEIGQS